MYKYLMVHTMQILWDKWGVFTCTVLVDRSVLWSRGMYLRLELGRWSDIMSEPVVIQNRRLEKNVHACMQLVREACRHTVSAARRALSKVTSSTVPWISTRSTLEFCSSMTPSSMAWTSASLFLLPVMKFRCCGAAIIIERGGVWPWYCVANLGGFFYIGRFPCFIYKCH